MQPSAAITGHIDVALVVLYAFWIFFFCLVVYLQRESRREGFPMVPDTVLEVRARKGDMGLATPPKKRYLTLFDGLVYVPERERADTRPIAAVPAFRAPGSPLIPTGNPLVDGVGPAAYAPRVDFPERTFEGLDRIVPMRVAHEHYVASEDRDPRGMPVLAADGRLAGTVTDLWVDRSEGVVRYVELELSDHAVVTRGPEVHAAVVEREVDVVAHTAGGETVVAVVETETVEPVVVTPEMFGRRVLMPIGFARVDARRRRLETKAITAAQFGDVPRIASPSQITLAEEDRIVGYFGGGALYATPLRAEPLL
ncbi:photosynthetic reaction center subunit H [Acuticoccus kandeliae]|uniref:photosynthetic reaction center subunit H n=1 Tax=Acuticoccus kandeliae TaxID=2073160 RepID=UPI000D3EB251|nr:photosynthetic reaction center subunit H [Acuticoccus kandeliae]